MEDFHGSPWSVPASGIYTVSQKQKTSLPGTWRLTVRDDDDKLLYFETNDLWIESGSIICWGSDQLLGKVYFTERHEVDSKYIVKIERC